MSRKLLKKKFDFYNGGKGIDLSDYCSQMSLEESSPNPEAVGHANLQKNPSYEEPPSPSANSTSYFPSSQKLYNPGCSSPPIYASPSENYPPSPNSIQSPYSSLEYQEESQGNLYDQPLYPHQHQQMPSTGSGRLPPHAQPHLPPYSPCAMLGNFNPQPVLPESCYGGYMSHSSYAPLRPMNPNEMLPLEGPYNVGSTSMVASQVPGVDQEEATKKRKRQQKCSLCSNHGITVDVKGHKWFCPFRNCECERCEITKGRQFHMKEQQKLTRSLNRMQ